MGSVLMKTDLSPYSGRWVALIRGRVVGQGGTPEQALQAAVNTRHKETPKVIYVSMSTPLHFSQIFEQIIDIFPPDIPSYLVGGAVRDVLLSREIHDYDFILPRGSLKIARLVADRMGGAFFMLDKDRETARVIFNDEQGNRKILDFASLRGPDLESDLRDRDFTVNALAVNVFNPQEMLDPLGGARDLVNKTLRVCSPDSFTNDPVRVLRAVRIAAGFGLRIQPETRSLMRSAVPDLVRVSPERLRDELLRILGGPKPHTSIRALDMLGILSYILPELSELKNVPQSPPHVKDVWGHTLDILKELSNLLGVLSQKHDPDKTSSLIAGLGSVRLGRYREQIEKHLFTETVVDRELRPLIFLAALYHDIAKPQVQRLDENGRIRFFNHDELGAGMVAQRAAALHLSNAEIDRLSVIVKNHMRPTHLARDEREPSPRAIYRFFRDTKDAGIDICLIALADLMATYGTTLPQKRWAKQLDVVRILMDAWWENPNKKVTPEKLITGRDLLDDFGLDPGPLIGELLEVVREAQVMGQVTTREDAIEFLRKYLLENSKEKS